MKDHRYIPAWPFPPYIFIPGVNPHPKKSGGHMEGEADPVATPINLKHPEQSEFLRFSLDLYNHGYYWESHVYFEALWNAHGRVGSEADFLKAMIKLGAGGVKLRLSQSNLALDHFLRAKELFNSVLRAEGEIFLGFNLSKIITQLDQMNTSHLEIFSIYPEWK